MSGLTRRGFLQWSGLAAGSLVLGCSSSPKAAWQQSAPSSPAVFDAFLAITPQGEILVQVHKVEMGQGTYTAFATLVGEELRTPPARITLVSAAVDSAFGNPMQGTGGSNSLSTIWTPLRETAARAREMLRAAAAQQWDIDVDGITLDDGELLHPNGRDRLGFGALAAAAAEQRVPSDVALTPPDAWRYIGRELPRVDGHDKSTGRARYGMDVKLPGMRTAVVAHCPHALGTLVSFDATKAEQRPGVDQVFEVPGGVAVVARDYWTARSAARELELQWDPGPSRGVDTAFIRRGLASALDEGDLENARDDGNAADVLEAAAQILEAEYALPYLAHATMEPMNCTVAPRDGGCDVYMGTQAPDFVQDTVAHELGIARSDVQVHNQLLGGGFGRRFFPDMAAEAARIARHTGTPVKLVWSREDDMARDYYRPPSLHRLRASLREDGQPEAWEHTLAAPSLLPHMGKDAGGALAPQWMRGFANWVANGLVSRIPGWFGPILAIEGANDQPYAIENVNVEAVAWDPGIPVGIWRSVGHSHNGFVVESFIDELAHAAGADPAAYRRALLADHPRHTAVLDLLVDKAGWGQPPSGVHQGLAVHEAFGSVVGQVAEVSVEGDRLRVHRVTCVVDCGLAVNPDIVKAQMESAIHFGLTAALYGEIHFEDGAAVESNFHDHRMLQMAEAPEIEVHILPSEAPPSGVGEPGTPPIAPAVANALFAATGKRLRQLPLRLT